MATMWEKSLKKYESPNLNTTVFETQDVITESDGLVKYDDKTNWDWTKQGGANS